MEVLRCRKRKKVSRDGATGWVRCNRRAPDGEHEGKHLAWFGDLNVEWTPIRWFRYEDGKRKYL